MKFFLNPAFKWLFSSVFFVFFILYFKWLAACFPVFLIQIKKKQFSILELTPPLFGLGVWGALSLTSIKTKSISNFGWELIFISLCNIGLSYWAFWPSTRKFNMRKRNLLILIGINIFIAMTVYLATPIMHE